MAGHARLFAPVGVVSPLMRQVQAIGEWQAGVIVGMPVSSMISARIGPRCSMTGSTWSDTAASIASSDQSALATT